MVESLSTLQLERLDLYSHYRTHKIIAQRWDLYTDPEFGLQTWPALSVIHVTHRDDDDTDIYEAEENQSNTFVNALADIKRPVDFRIKSGSSQFANLFTSVLCFENVQKFTYASDYMEESTMQGIANCIEAREAGLAEFTIVSDPERPLIEYHFADSAEIYQRYLTVLREHTEKFHSFHKLALVLPGFDSLSEEDHETISAILNSSPSLKKLTIIATRCEQADMEYSSLSLVIRSILDSDVSLSLLEVHFHYDEEFPIILEDLSQAISNAGDIPPQKMETLKITAHYERFAELSDDDEDEDEFENPIIPVLDMKSGLSELKNSHKIQRGELHLQNERFIV